jgi:glycosyltransferase involved in cell wall biosynthesis
MVAKPPPGPEPRLRLGVWRALDSVDVVLAFGPHPFSLVLAVMAVVRGRPVVLGSREDTMVYLANRLPSPRWRVALVPMRAVDRAFRALARRHPAVVVGHQLEARFGGPRPGLLAFEVSLVADAQVVRGPREEPWGRGRVSLLSVGRLEQEKNPLLLVELMRRLEDARPGRYHLTVVGTGRMLAELRDRCTELGLDDAVALAGFVPFGEELLRRYREADAFVHTARTEAVPQVLVEAMACATPLVATDVGGVRRLLQDGRAGLLVAPDDAVALYDAVRGLDDEPGRVARVTQGLAQARGLTLEATAARLARFVTAAAQPGAQGRGVH